MDDQIVANVEYLSVTDILVLHELLLLEFGGLRGITEQGFGRLETAVGAPRQSMFGDDLYPTLPEKAAALFRSIIGGHPFSDGNKRVALLALCELLERNGAVLNASNDEVYQLAITTASSLDRDQVSAWMQEHVCIP